MVQLIRAAACGYPSVISHVGLGTFVDPRQDGGKLNQRTKEDLVEVVTVDGRKYLSYKVVPLEVAIIRGTTADEDGNITMEQGTIGGVPLTGVSGAAQVNPQAIIDRCYQFEFYQGGGLDIGFLSFGQLDQKGNVNVSKLGHTVQGVGGFVDISQNAKKLVLCGLFSGPGTSLEITEDRVRILKEGKYCKFKRPVDQISFSGELARRRRQRVVCVTERAVFELQRKGVVLTEVAPGIDIDKDILSHMEFKPLIAENLKTMDMRVFREGQLGIKEEWQLG